MSWVPSDPTTDRYVRQVYADMGNGVYRAPHCDELVLHAPGRCEFCDKNAEWQRLREYLGINYTGESDDRRVVCPAEQRRPRETVNLWYGNVATKDKAEDEGSCAKCGSPTHFAGTALLCPKCGVIGGF